jgi:hypothetical protein
MHAWKRVFALLAAVILSVSLPASYAADVFPEVHYVATCKTDQPDSAGNGETLGICNDGERSRNWPERGPNFALDEKTQCIKETNIDGTPSYVELHICLKMASDVRARVRNGPRDSNAEW